MKSAELADLMERLAGALGEGPMGPVLGALAPGFRARGEATARASVAALAALPVPSGHGGARGEVAAAAGALRALADALAAELKPGPRGDLLALAEALAGRGDAPLGPLAEAWAAAAAETEAPPAPPRAAGAGAVAEIARHSRAIEAAMGDEAAFEAALAELETAARPRGPLMAADVAAVARAALGRSVGRGRADALAALRKAHRDILDSRARRAARDGRSAG